MQLIAVDIGNSWTKLAIQQSPEDQRWWVKANFDNAIPFTAKSLADEKVHLDSTNAFWAVSSENSVRSDQIKTWLAEHRPHDQFHCFLPADIAIESDVESRDSVGRDRLVAAAMALELNDHAGPLIVVDAGTAVTIDFVDSNGVFQGGLIYPGATSNLRMLSESTDALPDLSSDQFLHLAGDLTKEFIGKSTRPAILRGVYQAQIGAIKQIVADQSSSSDQTPAVYLTGGGIKAIDSALPEPWIRVPDLVLRGARSIGRRLINERSE